MSHPLVYPRNTVFEGRFSVQNVLETGSFGYSYMAIDMQSGAHVVLISSIQNPFSQAELAFLLENRMNRHFPSFLHFGITAPGNYLNIVTSYEGESVKTIKNRSRGRMSTEAKISFLYNAFLAVHEVHRLGYTHGNVCLQNFRVSHSLAKMHIVLTDFTDVKKIVNRRFFFKFRGYLRSRRAPPQVLRGQWFCDRCDLFHLAMDLVELMGFSLETEPVTEEFERADLIDRRFTMLDQNVVGQDRVLLPALRALYQPGVGNVTGINYQNILASIEAMPGFHRGVRFV